MPNDHLFAPMLACGYPSSVFFALLCFALIVIMTCALGLGFVAKLLGRQFGNRTRTGLAVLAEVALAGCLVYWFGIWAWSFVTDSNPLTIGVDSDSAWFVATIFAPLILIPFGKWYWRWLTKEQGD